jgi:hypothetical protein
MTKKTVLGESSFNVVIQTKTRLLWEEDEGRKW